MASIHMSEAEVARDFHAVMEEVRRGREVVIDFEEGGPVAILGLAKRRSGRPVSEILRMAEGREFLGSADDEFANDLEEIVALRDRPWTPPSWD